MFILLTLALALITVLFLLLPFLSKKKQQLVVERDAVNVESAATRLAELKQELENGLINEEQFQKYQLESSFNMFFRSSSVCGQHSMYIPLIKRLL